MTTPVKAIIGDDGWLFLANDTNQTWDQFEGRLLLGDDDLAAWQQEFQQRGSFMRDNHIHYRFIVAPNKECVFPEKVPSGMHKATYRLVHQIEQAAKGQVHGLFLEKFFCAHPQRDACYDKGDTHWNQFGGWHVANHILNGLETRKIVLPVVQQDLAFRCAGAHVGDLSVKFAPPHKPWHSAGHPARTPSPLHL
jgi:alginate O-acetyltransferase complex protein AlgJ